VGAETNFKTSVQRPVAWSLPSLYKQRPSLPYLQTPIWLSSKYTLNFCRIAARFYRQSFARSQRYHCWFRRVLRDQGSVSYLFDFSLQRASVLSIKPSDCAASDLPRRCRGATTTWCLTERCWEPINEPQRSLSCPTRSTPYSLLLPRLRKSFLRRFHQLPYSSSRTTLAVTPASIR
jgi:hypothetical protein